MMLLVGSDNGGGYAWVNRDGRCEVNVTKKKKKKQNKKKLFCFIQNYPTPTMYMGLKPSSFSSTDSTTTVDSSTSSSKMG